MKKKKAEAEKRRIEAFLPPPPIPRHRATFLNHTFAGPNGGMVASTLGSVPKYINLVTSTPNAKVNDHIVTKTPSDNVTKIKEDSELMRTLYRVSHINCYISSITQ